MAPETVREKLARRVMVEGLTVRATESLASKGPVASQGAIKSRRSRKALAKTPETNEIEERLRRKFGTKVSLDYFEEEQGELRIAFFSKEELKTLLDKMV